MNNLRYADDEVIVSGNKKNMQEMLTDVQQQKVGLQVNDNIKQKHDKRSSTRTPNNSGQNIRLYRRMHLLGQIIKCESAIRQRKLKEVLDTNC